MGKHLYMGLSGLGSDVQTVCVRHPTCAANVTGSCRSQTLTFRHNLYKLREQREMSPFAFLNATCSLLYEKRYTYDVMQLQFALSMMRRAALGRTSLSPLLLD